MRRRSFIVHVAVLLVATVLLALAQTASAEVRRIADFAAGEVVRPGGFPTGGYVFVPRFTESTNRFSIVRISPSGQRNIAVRRPVPRGDDNIWGDQFPKFSGSESIVAARIDLWTDGSEGGLDHNVRAGRRTGQIAAQSDRPLSGRACRRSRPTSCRTVSLQRRTPLQGSHLQGGGLETAAGSFNSDPPFVRRSVQGQPRPRRDGRQVEHQPRDDSAGTTQPSETDAVAAESRAV